MPPTRFVTGHITIVSTVQDTHTHTDRQRERERETDRQAGIQIKLVVLHTMARNIFGPPQSMPVTGQRQTDSSVARQLH